MSIIGEEDVKRALDAEEAEEPAYTATEILEKVVASKRGRVGRGRELTVYCLIQDKMLLRWLLLLGAKFFAGSRDGYRRSTEGPIEWDLYLHIIPTKGDETWWEAAEPFITEQRRRR